MERSRGDHARLLDKLPKFARKRGGRDSISERTTYILIAGFALFVVGVFFLGQYTAGVVVKANTKAIYDQGYAVGEASGINKMQLQCADQLLALRDNCKGGWISPDMHFGLVNLTPGGSP